MLLAAAARTDLHEEVVNDVMWGLAYAADHDPDALPLLAGCQAALNRAAEITDNP